MNKEELNQIKKQIEELNNKVKELENKKDKFKKWKPERGEYYFFYNFEKECIYRGTYGQDFFRENLNLLIDNCFKTKEETEQNREKVLKNLEKLELQKELQDYAEEVNEGWKPDWGDREDYKYHIYFNHITNEYENREWLKQHLNEPVFKSEELAEQAIKHFGNRLNLLIED